MSLTVTVTACGLNLIRHWQWPRLLLCDVDSSPRHLPVCGTGSLSLSRSRSNGSSLRRRRAAPARGVLRLWHRGWQAQSATVTGAAARRRSRPGSSQLEGNRGTLSLSLKGWLRPGLARDSGCDQPAGRVRGSHRAIP